MEEVSNEASSSAVVPNLGESSNAAAVGGHSNPPDGPDMFAEDDAEDEAGNNEAERSTDPPVAEEGGERVLDVTPEQRAALVEMVDLVTSSERRSRRNLQLALRTLAGNLNEGQEIAGDIDPDYVPPLTVTPSRKRRRITSQSPSPPQPEKAKKQPSEDDDDGSTCPICLDSWEMSGEHRLISLKCGHLFGENCIRRWFSGATAAGRCCPSCKSKANLRDIRYIFAKRISVVDKPEEYRLQSLVESETIKVSQLNQEVALLRLELDLQRKFNEKLEQQLAQTKMNAINMNVAFNMSQTSVAPRAQVYKLSRESTINICPEPGCRVMIHGRKLNSLIVSQKSVQSLFPGFGVRFVDLPSFRATSFLHMSTKQVRDLALDTDEQVLAAASMDRTCKLYTINNRGVCASFTPSDKPIWSVAFEKSRSKMVYFGTQHGNAYSYDIRQPNTFIAEYKAPGDLSPVINICSVSPHQPEFPFGGFLVCKLQSLWFYEYTSSQTVHSTKLALVGPFVSMSFEDTNKNILIATRPTSSQPLSKYIFGQLRKVNETATLHVITAMPGTRVQAVMSRSTQINYDNSTLVGAYLQDIKVLQTWQIREDQQQHLRMQSLPIDECVLDTCPIYLENNTFVGALTETKCRIFRVYGEDA